MKIIGKQFGITPAAGKRLIAKGMAAHESIRLAIEGKRIVVIIAGTTNGYVAEEILKGLGQQDGFEKRRFFRGVTVPPHQPLGALGRLSDESEFLGDVVIKEGIWQKGKTIFDVRDQLKKGDVVVKGANAVSLPSLKPALYIGHPESGTIGASLPVIVGKRVRLMVPVGLEKRIVGDLDAIAREINNASTSGPRMLPLYETAYTEIQALSQLSGATAQLVAAGGIGGAEGLCWLLARGTAAQIETATKIVDELKNEPLFDF